MNKNAFTLVETMVVVAVFSIIIAAIFTVLATGRNSWLNADTYIQVEQEIRKAKEGMQKELIQGRYSTANITGNNDDIIDFEVPLNVSQGGFITWQPVRYDLNNNAQLIRTSGADVRVLANDITAVVFTPDPANPILTNVAVTATIQNIRGEVIGSTLTFDTKFRN